MAERDSVQALIMAAIRVAEPEAVVEMEMPVSADAKTDAIAQTIAQAVGVAIAPSDTEGEADESVYETADDGDDALDTDAETKTLAAVQPRLRTKRKRSSLRAALGNDAEAKNDAAAPAVSVAGAGAEAV